MSEDDKAELERHQRVLAAQDAIMRCPSFADLHRSPSLCALDMAEAVIDRLFPRPSH